MQAILLDFIPTDFHCLASKMPIVTIGQGEERGYNASLCTEYRGVTLWGSSQWLVDSSVTGDLFGFAQTRIVSKCRTFFPGRLYRSHSLNGKRDNPDTSLMIPVFVFVCIEEKGSSPL